jgi:[glutamine synthetase] adenylyltransferase / [glutamine synthetase]-adenylyl-L-tyrosine phosphorylase
MPLTPSEKKNGLLQATSFLPPELVQAHVKRLDSDYFNEFTSDEILHHLGRISDFKNRPGFVFEFAIIDEFSYGLTVIGDDLQGFFAVLTGLLASYDFDIRLGKVFTYAREQPPKATGSFEESIRGRIIDYLILEHSQKEFLTASLEAKLVDEINTLIELLRTRQTQDLRKDLYRRIGSYLSRHCSDLETPRLPLEIHIESDDRQTVLIAQGTDRKALLFSLSNALMLQGISIYKLLTKSVGTQFEDHIYITNGEGNSITDLRTLDRLKVATVLMERFTATLPQASDYPAAIESFNEFIGSLMDKSGGKPNLPAFEDYAILASLAKILSAGPYLWEGLSKLPLADLTNLLKTIEEEKQPLKRTIIEEQLKDELEKATTYANKVEALNRFKDYQLFRLDIIYLIFTHKTLQEFSGELTDLADATLDAALWLAYDKLRAEFGEPKVEPNTNSNSTPCHFGLFAQGKLGGRELGYASDLELQLLYGNQGETQGAEKSVSHAEFFSLLVQEVRSIIIAKKEGIFELDLRLRPHGDSGPLASRADTWVEYYSEDGGALDFERQALLKLRAVTTTPGFVDRIMLARDALVFGESPVGIDNTLKLRTQQISLKVGSPSKSESAINAKYSPGGLVEVEYAVQFLQLQHGRKVSALRGPNTETTLEVLLAEGILLPGDFEKLYKGYVLLRRLINALRMVRGHSRDLLIPARGTPEFLHLAKRMGYLTTPKFEPNAQLDWELKQTLKDVHNLFVRKFLGVNEPESESPSITATFLAPSSSPDSLRQALAFLGVATIDDPARLILELFSPVKEKGLLCASLVISAPKLRASPDAVVVLQHLGKFLRAVPDPDYFVRQMLNHPHLQELLIKAFGHSEYLTQILLQQPDYLFALGNPRALEKQKLFPEFLAEINSILLESERHPYSDEDEKNFQYILEEIRKYRNQEYLRIGLRDIFLGTSLARITAEISQLSNALIQVVYELTMKYFGIWKDSESLAVIALGKLGGNELNYSSDIDIVFVYDENQINPSEHGTLEKWAKFFVTSLSQFGAHGKLFRVDVQLRPYGGHSSLLGSMNHYQEYYPNSAAGWELQAWLKARPLAGNAIIGLTVISEIQALAVSPAYRHKIETSMRQVRKLGLEKLRQEDRLSSEVKLGPGGIRTIEFYVQYLQILHGQALPELVSGNTLAVLSRLFRYRLISHNYFEILTKSYIFLRRIEHVLQLQGLQQRHELPATAEELEKLAKRMGFEDRIGQSAASQFRTRYRQHMLTLLELSSSLFGYETNLPIDS